MNRCLYRGHIADGLFFLFGGGNTGPTTAPFLFHAEYDLNPDPTTDFDNGGKDASGDNTPILDDDERAKVEPEYPRFTSPGGCNVCIASVSRAKIGLP